MRALMVCGTTSGAGKSFLATALARCYARMGLKVAPFKAQNMSNNARVVEGGEMGSAQYFQALAACAVPDVRMNPILLKPERDDGSQVIVLGQRRDDLQDVPWRDRAQVLWPIVQASLSQLLEQNDLVIIEGAGSPAEINLSSSDIVNMRVAEFAHAAVLLITDIDRGGAFAHLYGTVQLLPEHQRRLVKGFVLNKFRGDPQLLPPGPQLLRELTGIDTLAVLPLWRDHGLPEEDGVLSAPLLGAGTSVAVLAYPHISNLDEFAPLNRLPNVALAWARSPQVIRSADLLILPGSKHVASDLAWLNSQQLAPAVAAHMAAGKPTLAVCGGLQMLGSQILDPDGVEAGCVGLGLAPWTTRMSSPKRYARGRYRLGALQGYWQALSGMEFQGYEIRHGATKLDEPGAVTEVVPGGLGWQQQNTLALYPHGLFENAQLLQALFGHDAGELNQTLDALGEFALAHFGESVLKALVGRG
jgi:adenosylcobyric acid synthase